MRYKMECSRCGKEMIYIEDKKMEELGWVVMDCPEGCNDRYLVPDDNPYLKREEANGQNNRDKKQG